jgi:ribosomal-protein-alanine N-acetyltransferase
MNAVANEPRTLQAMTLRHLDAVLAIELKCYEFPWNRGNFIDSLDAGHVARILCGANGELLGYFVALQGLDEMHLLNLSVAPEAQGRGHARYMLEALVVLSRTLGARQLWLEVRESNARARAIYGHFGFADVGVRKRYYPAAQGRREDAVVMRMHSDRSGPELSHALD